MTSNRLARIIRARWWLLVGIALVAFVVAGYVTGLRNAQIPTREAVAPITFNRLLAELDNSGLDARLKDAYALAKDVNAPELEGTQGPLSPWKTAAVVLDDRGNRLVFVGRARSDADAREIAIDLRDRYLENQTLDNREMLDERIATVTADLEDVTRRLTALRSTPPPTPEDLARRQRIAELESEISALTTRYGTLSVQILNPPQGTTVEELRAEQDKVQESLSAAQLELATLQADEPAPDPSTSLQEDLLQTRQNQLQAALDELVLQRIQQEPIGSIDPVEVHPADVAPASAFTAQAVGILIGLLVGIAGLVVLDRLRRPIWSTSDLEPGYRLAAFPARSDTGAVNRGRVPWYATGETGPRRAGIQELRSQIEGLPWFGDRFALGIAGLGSSPREVHELAADLAYSLAGSGSRVLLVDADFDDPSDLVEFKGRRIDLEAALRTPEEVVASIAEGVDDRRPIAGISLVAKATQAPDLMAQPRFNEFLERARVAFDIVVLACPTAGTAGYHVLTQRLDSMILAAAAGSSRIEDVEDELRELENRRAEPLGVVVLTSRPSRLTSLVEDLIARFRPEPELFPRKIPTTPARSATPTRPPSRPATPPSTPAPPVEPTPEAAAGDEPAPPRRPAEKLPQKPPPPGAARRRTTTSSKVPPRPGS